MEFIMKYEKLVCKIASKYSCYSNFEDLKQVGMIGLLKAVDNLGRGQKPSSRHYDKSI